jgi:hypothetical protein
MLTHFRLDILHSIYSSYSNPYYYRYSLNGSRNDSICIYLDDYFGMCHPGLTLENKILIDESTF